MRPSVDLPQPGLADEADRLAALDRERDAVDRLDVADVAVEHDAARQLEPDAEVVDLDERPAAVDAHALASSRLRSHAPASTG